MDFHDESPWSEGWSRTQVLRTNPFYWPGSSFSYRIFMGKSRAIAVTFCVIRHLSPSFSLCFRASDFEGPINPVANPRLTTHYHLRLGASDIHSSLLRLFSSDFSSPGLPIPFSECLGPGELKISKKQCVCSCMHNMHDNGDTDSNDNMIGEAEKPRRFCFPWQRRKPLPSINSPVGALIWREKILTSRKG